MAIMNLRRNARLRKHAGKYKWMLAIAVMAAFIVLCNVSFAAERLPKYQIVVGSDEKAYLLDTTTGFVWILTYRTLATGREPVAIPYKFIRISPMKQKDFMVEDVSGASLPANGTP
jgi:hypothetical protein